MMEDERMQEEGGKRKRCKTKCKVGEMQEWMQAGEEGDRRVEEVFFFPLLTENISKNKGEKQKSALSC